MAAVRAAAGIFAGFILLAAFDAVAIAVGVPMPAAGGAGAAGLGLRAAHHVFDAAETLGVGVAFALAVFAFRRFVKLPSWAMTTLAIATTIAVALATIHEFVERIASQLFEGRHELPIFVAYLALIGFGFTDVLRVAREASVRPRLRFVPVGVGVLALVVDQLVLRDDYFAIHGLAAVGAAMVAGAGLAPLAERAGLAMAQSRRGRVGLGSIALFALFGLAWPPPNATRLELFEQPCAVAPWLLATTVWREPRLHAPVVVAPSPWNQDRSKAPAVPPTSPPLFPRAPVVVLMTIDALRADAVNGPENDALFPTFARLKREGVVFKHASAPGTQTPVSLSTLFSGLYFSEQKWTGHGLGRTRYLYPAEDPFPRFPQLLSDHGVATAMYGGLSFLAGEFGVARGFREERVVVTGRDHAQAKELVGPLLERLKRAADSPDAGPLFLYTHLMDPHWPYDRGRRGGVEGSDHERYLSEVAVADAAVGQVESFLTERFADRWALFVSADHGEAFGEHGTTGHAKTLYEELLHVPLMARSPRFPPRTIDQRVGLIDLGPTLLDLFGVATPATFNGQSLASLLAGGGAELTRPLIAEGRFRRALTQPDGFKVIEDPRRKVVEAYDLVADPGETRNVFDLDPGRSDAGLAELRAFFAVHTRARTEAGYETPYEP